MLLQADFTPGSGTYTAVFQVYSPDGLTAYETATTYFDYFFAVNPFTGKHFISARLKGYSPAMCTHRCFLIRLTVTDGSTAKFDKYTERYCQFSCCDVARDISVIQDGLIVFEDPGTTTTNTNPKVSACGDTYITLRTKYDCYDKFTGVYYGIPSTVLSGTGFEYENISNFRGRVVRRPREITREYSYNCRLQRVESAPQYLFQGFEHFPSWKMFEIEGQLHSTEIYVDDTRYEFNGGTIFETIHDCIEAFKLETALQDCTIRQVFGCNNDCAPALNYDGAQAMYVIPQAYHVGAASPFQPTDGFYSETGVFIAEDYDGLLDYMRNQDGITAVTDIDITGIDCEVYKAFSISGTGYVPTSFYYGSVSQPNRVFSVVLGSVDDICDSVPVTCAAPELGTPTVEEDSCAAPVLGTPVVEDMEVTGIEISEYGNWEWSGDPAQGASLYNNQVTFTLSLGNALLAPTSSPLTPPFVYGEQVAIIASAGRPLVDVNIDSSNSNLPVGSAMRIDTAGRMFYYGLATSADLTASYLDLVDITYNTV